MTPDSVALNLERFAKPILFAQGCGIDPDPWQRKVLESKAQNLIMLSSRQSGKSCCAALVALHTCLYNPRTTVVIASASQRQAKLLLRKHILVYYRRLKDPPVDLKSATQENCIFDNDSEVYSLPADPDTIRGVPSVHIAIIDEAARTKDVLFNAITPMLAATNGRMIALTTPAGKRGWLFREFNSTDHGWEKHVATYVDCPRYSTEFIERERQRMGDTVFAQEYMSSFNENVYAVYTYDEIHRAVRSDYEPLFPIPA